MNRINASSHGRPCYFFGKIFRNSKILLFLFFTLSFFLPNSLRAQNVGDYQSLADGSWNDRTIWGRWNGTAYVTPTTLQGYPGQLSANRNVIVQNNVTLNVSPAFSIANLDITNEMTLTTAGNPNLILTGNFHVISTGLVQPAFCTFGNGNLTIGGTLVLDDVCTLTFGTGILNVTGTTTIGAEATLTNGGTFNTANTVTINTFWLFVYFDGNFQNNGTVNMTNTAAGALGGNGIWTQGANSTFNYAGNTMTIRVLYASNTGNTVNYNRNGAQTIEPASGNTYHHLTLSIANTKTSSSNLDINGNLTISGTAQLDVNAGTDDITLAGNWSVTSTNTDPFVEGTRTVNFDGAGQTISTVLAAGETFYNLTISNSGNKQSSVVLDVNGNLLISGSAQLTMNALALSLAGNWTVTSNSGDPFVQTTNTVTFNGSTPQTLTTALAAGETFYNFIINNSSVTSPQITASDAITVTNVVTMLDGNVNLTGNTFTISSSAAGALSHTMVSGVGWMYGGPIARTFLTTAVTEGTVAGFYPLGSSANFRPLFIGKSNTANSNGTLTISHTDAATTSAVSIADGASTVVLRHDSYWDATVASMSAGTFSILAGGTGFGTIGNTGHLRLVPPAAPVVGTAGTNSGPTTDPRVQRTGLTRAQLFGNNFHIGSINYYVSPLPIELLSFTAQLKNNVVELKWSTASETNNDFFTIERATDVEHFETILTLDGKGTTKELNHYSLKDSSPLYGRSYYRLKQTDFDGKFTYSEVKTIDYDGPEFATLTAFPSPLNDPTLNIKIEGLKEAGNVQLQILNLRGQKVFEKVIEIKTPGIITEEISRSTFPSSGLYIIKAGETLYLTKKIVIE